MKQYKCKIIALLFAVAIAASAGGCSFFGLSPEPTPVPTPAPTPEPEPEELVFVLPGEVGAQEARGLKAVNAALREEGIVLSVRRYAAADYQNKIDLLVRSDVGFDLFTQNGASYPRAVREGLVTELQPEAALTALFSEEQWKNATVDGSIYGVPVYAGEANGFASMLGYRSDILKKAEYETFPSEDFEQAFIYLQRAMTPEGTDASAFSWLSSPGDVPVWLHRTYERYPFSVDNDLHLALITEEGAVESYYESQEFRSDAIFYRGLFVEGLTTEEFAKGGSKKLADGNILPSQGFNNQNAVAKNLAFAAVGDAPAYVTNLGTRFTTVSKTTKDADLALRLLTWLYSKQENFDLFHFGTEGTDYTLDAEGRITKTKDAYGMATAYTGYLPLMRYTPKVSQAYIEALTQKDPKAEIASSAYFYFDGREVQEEARLLKKAVQTYLYPIKFGFVSYTKNIDEAVGELRAAGLDRYLAEYQKQYKAYLQKGKTSGATPTPAPTVKPSASPTESGEPSASGTETPLKDDEA